MTPREGHKRPPNHARLVVLIIASGVLITAGSLGMLLVGLVTAFQARRLYANLAGWLCSAVLSLWSIRLAIRQHAAMPAGQVVYVSNHPCTIDLFVLVALRLPNTRFFLSGFLQRYVPLAIVARLMGTFFTVPQDRPAERVAIFKRADRILRRTRESVYLSPEGQRVTTGEIGSFNKGAFHLATSLGAPIVPIYFDVPEAMNPGRGFDARPGTITVHFLPAIDTSGWRLEDVPVNRERVRDLFVHWHDTLRVTA